MIVIVKYLWNISKNMMQLSEATWNSYPYIHPIESAEGGPHYSAATLTIPMLVFR